MQGNLKNTCLTHHAKAMWWIRVSNRKRSIQLKWNERENHAQEKCVSRSSVKISCTTTHFPWLLFCGPYKNSMEFRCLSKNYHSQVETKLGNGKCEIRRISCACVSCTKMLDNTWDPGVAHVQKICYQPVVDWTYWSVFVYFNNCDTIQFTNKSISSEDFDGVNKIVLDGFSANMAQLVHMGTYGDINTADTTTTGYYVVNYFSDSIIL